MTSSAYGYDPQQLGAALWGGFVFGMIVYLLIIAVFVAAYWQMFKKAGYSGALSLLLFVPLANIILILWFGFADWPVQQELRALRASGGGPGYGSGYTPASYNPPAYSPPATPPAAPPAYAPPAVQPSYQPPAAPAPEVAPQPVAPAYTPSPAPAEPPVESPPAPPGAEPPTGS